MGLAYTIHLLLAVLIAYPLALAYYRLKLSPLAGFPGPKLAAVTSWYEAYYEIIHKGGGQFTFAIMRMHRRYGPIVRISPHELHIDDINFYGELYTSSRGLDKSPHVQHRFGAPGAAFSTPEHDVHKRRRNAIAPFFSKRRINEQAPRIRSLIERIAHRLAAEYAGTGKVLSLGELYASFVSDAIMSYAFNRSHAFLDEPDFVCSFARSLQGLKDYVHYAQQFPSLLTVMLALPAKLVTYLQPHMKASLDFQQEMHDQIEALKAGQDDSAAKSQEGTIFHSLLQSNLPARDLHTLRLRDEAVSIVGAGIETTKMAMVVASFHIITNAAIRETLHTELVHAIPDPQSPPPLTELEKLPYLHACIQEGVRLSYGAVARSQRISRHGPIFYGPWAIPQDAMVSMDSYHMHHSEDAFPQSHTYRPERWLSDAERPDGLPPPPTSYLTAFGRGTRMCVGFSLAYAEMTLLLAALFRSFEFELHETDVQDVECYRDMIGIEVAPGSKGVRVIVH